MPDDGGHGVRAWPIKAVEQYADRPRLEGGRRETAREFFERVWAETAATGAVFSDDLRRADRQLYIALIKALEREGRRINDIMPTSPTRGQLPHIRTLEDQALHYRAVSAAKKRRLRAAKLTRHP